MRASSSNDEKLFCGRGHDMGLQEDGTGPGGVCRTHRGRLGSGGGGSAGGLCGGRVGTVPRRRGQGLISRRGAPGGRGGVRVLEDGIIGFARSPVVSPDARDEVAKTRAPRVALCVGWSTGGCRRSTAGEAAVWGAGDILGLAEPAIRARVVQRRDAHERNLQLAVDVQKRVAPRVGDACDGVAADRERAASKVDFLSEQVRWLF